MTKLHSGVCGHSEDSFWDEYDLFSVKSGMVLSMADSEALRSFGGYKSMIMRCDTPKLMVCRVLMLRRSARDAVWKHFGLIRGDNLFDDEFYEIGMPQNLGGGQFTWSFAKGSWDSDLDEPCEHIGYIKQSNRMQANSKPFILNDYTQGMFWSIEPERPKLPKTRSIGKALPLNDGYRYKGAVA